MKKKKKLIPIGEICGIKYKSYRDGLFYEHLINNASLSTGGVLYYDPKTSMFKVEFFGVEVDRQIIDVNDYGWKLSHYKSFLRNLTKHNQKLKKYDWAEP